MKNGSNYPFDYPLKIKIPLKKGVVNLVMTEPYIIQKQRDLVLSKSLCS